METIACVLRSWRQALVGRGDLRKDTDMVREHYCNGDQGLSVTDVKSPVEVGTAAATP